MTDASTPPYFGRTMFAEDVRREMSGQLTIVGAISGGLYLDSFPGSLGRLALLIEYQQREDQEILPITIKAFAPGSDEPIFEHTHKAEDIQSSQEALADPDCAIPYPGPRVRRITQVTVFAGLNIEKPGLISIRGFRGDEVLAMGSMPIGRQPLATPT